MLISEKIHGIKLSTDALTNLSADAAGIFKKILKAEDRCDQDKEHLWSIGLSVSGGVKYIDLVHLGSLTGTITSPRDIVRMAILKGVAGIIIGHNHPSGQCLPSAKDKKITTKIQDACSLFDIALADHIIIGNNTDDYYSFADNGDIICISGEEG